MIDVLLLRTEVYKVVNEAPIPSRRGFGMLLVYLVTAALAIMIGAALNSASMSDDDAEREYAYDHSAEGIQQVAQDRGWTTISMKDDFEQIFAETVVAEKLNDD